MDFPRFTRQNVISKAEPSKLYKRYPTVAQRQQRGKA